MTRLLLTALLLCWPCLPAQAEGEGREDTRARLQAQIASEGLDWTATEYDRTFTLGSLDDMPTPRLAAEIPWTGPSAVDWRDHFNPVRDQGACGSCYAFASIAVLEALASIELGRRVDLSEQAMVSCGNAERGYRNEGCTGGYGSGAAMFLESEGVPLEWCMRYQACEAPCALACSARRSGAYRIRTEELTGFDVGSNRRALQKGRCTRTL
jgi:C1A family cysteine protease